MTPLLPVSFFSPGPSFVFLFLFDVVFMIKPQLKLELLIIALTGAKWQFEESDVQ